VSVGVWKYLYISKMVFFSSLSGLFLGLWQSVGYFLRVGPVVNEFVNMDDNLC